MNLLKPTNGPAFLETICTMIVNLLQPSNTNSKVPEKVEERELYLNVAREVFGLLDAIIYSLPPEYHYQLSRSFFFFLKNLQPTLMHSQVRYHPSGSKRSHNDAQQSTTNIILRMLCSHPFIPLHSCVAHCAMHARSLLTPSQERACFVR
jgi:hypothetical protein